jgi:hypothetical protein
MRSGPWSKMRRSRDTGSAAPRSTPPGGVERISAGSSTRRERPSPSLPYPAGRISPRRPGNDASPAWSARSKPKPRPGGREPEASPWDWGRSSTGTLIIVPRAWRDRPHPLSTRSGKACAGNSTINTPSSSPPSAKPLKGCEPETATPRSRSAASRQLCLSWVDSGQPAALPTDSSRLKALLGLVYPEIQTSWEKFLSTAPHCRILTLHQAAQEVLDGN